MKDINNIARLSIDEIVGLSDYAYNLKPLDGQQKSFYGKARVYVNKREHKIELKSYDTIVLYYDYAKQEYRRLWCEWSATTAQHVKAFCGRYLTKAEWLDLGIGLPVFSQEELDDERGLIIARRAMGR